MMIHKVFADGNEVAAEAGMNKALANFPDVCLSPPSPPAGPIPIPYPDFSFSKDLKKGSKKVKVKGKPAALKDQSYYKSSPLGDEAATRTFGANILTHQITGKTYFQMWSMDVKYEGKNVCRHCDLTSSNHASKISTTATVPTLESMNPPPPDGPKCDCCGGPVHSEAQARGEAITQHEWYDPGQSYPNKPLTPAEQQIVEWGRVVRRTAKEEGCSHLIHEDENDPCAKHYVTKEVVPEGGTRAYSEGTLNRRNCFDPMGARTFAADYYRNHLGYTRRQTEQIERTAERIRQERRDGARSIAHRTALAAGGCPVGDNNLAPVYDNCTETESLLGDIQNEIAQIHARRA